MSCVHSCTYCKLMIHPPTFCKSHAWDLYPGSSRIFENNLKIFVQRQLKNFKDIPKMYLPIFLKSNVGDFHIHITQISKKKSWWLLDVTEDIAMHSKCCWKFPKMFQWISKVAQSSSVIKHQILAPSCRDYAYI